MLGNQQQQQQDDCEQHPESSLSETPKLPLLLPSPKVENCFPTFSESQLTHFMISPESSTRTSNSSPQSEHSYSYKGIFTSTLIFKRNKYKKYLFRVNKYMRDLYTWLPREERKNGIISIRESNWDGCAESVFVVECEGFQPKSKGRPSSILEK